MRAHVRTRTDFGRIRLIWQNLAEVDQAGRIRQNSVKASSLSCRVFYRDIPTITRLVPLQRALKGRETDHGVFLNRVFSLYIYKE